MSAELLIVLGLPLLLALILLGLLIGRRRRSSTDGGPARRDSAAIREREAAIAAQLAVEEHDIDEMIEAQEAIRRRIGSQSIGEELLDDALDPRRDEPE